MTRAIVYGLGLMLTIACTIMTVASIAEPRWVSYRPNGHRKHSYGLHSRCSTVTGNCTPFPKTSDCAKDPSFCNMWRTVGFLISLSVMVELCTLVSFIVIIGGGVQRRVAGWQVAVGALMFSALVQCAGMAIVASLYNNNPRFSDGWELDTCFHLVTASWIILLALSLGILFSALYLPAEGDYELIPDLYQVDADDQLLSRIAAWDNGWKGSNSSEEYSYQRDQDAMSDFASIRSSRLDSNATRRESDATLRRGSDIPRRSSDAMRRGSDVVR